jgi:carbon monoxide dehydrogenase subunit G
MEIVNEIQSSGDARASCSTCGCGLKGFGKKLFVGLIAAAAVFCAVVASRPNDFKVSRSAMMAATPAAVFDQVNDFHKWDVWSPWAKMDPNAKTSYEGPTSGVGAKFGWSGNSDVGEGSMTIVESKPNNLVRIRLDFTRPMAGTSDVELKLEPQGEQTKVTWSMAGKNNFIAKAVSLFMDCEKMVGDQYDKGLANLKAIVEAKPEKVSGV